MPKYVQRARISDERERVNELGLEKKNFYADRTFQER